MKKRYIFLICISVLSMAFIMFVGDFLEMRWESGKEICKVDVCGLPSDTIMDEMYSEHDFYYFNNGLCNCFNYRDITKVKVVTPITNKIKEPIYS